MKTYVFAEKARYQIKSNKNALLSLLATFCIIGLYNYFENLNTVPFTNRRRLLYVKNEDLNDLSNEEFNKIYENYKNYKNISFFNIENI